VPIVSPNIRVRVPDHFEVGEGSVIDDFSYFSTRVKVGCGSHIASGCTVAGGAAYLFTLGDFSSISAGVRVWCSSNDFVNDLIAIGVEGDDPITGDVTIGNYTGVGANSVVMPANDVPEGVAIGALSFVPAAYRFEPWTVYAGTPIRPVKKRDRERVLRQVEATQTHQAPGA
jgi:acetyltransferase-like isoleucine patch superfamily enzyme